MIFLAADIGGTRARLLVGETEASGGWRVRRQETLSCSEFSGVEALLARFLRPREGVQAACLAVAGPVDGEVATLTNRPWRVAAQEVAGRFALRQVRLINDFAAQAHGLDYIGVGGLYPMQLGEFQMDAPRALLGAGTGLGMAMVIGPEDDPVVLASEGGHADFAPADEEQTALVRHLRPHLGRVSLESVLSGPGLERIHGFLYGRPAGAAPLLSAEEVHEAAQAGAPKAIATLALFARIYAAAAANLALTVLPQGGLYLCGGIAPRIQSYLITEAFHTAFLAKPPMEALLRRIPLYLVTDEFLGLWGAAKVAARLTPEP